MVQIAPRHVHQEMINMGILHAMRMEISFVYLDGEDSLQTNTAKIVSVLL